MPTFIMFVFASVVFGAGAMLCPALPTRSPRIGLAAALALGFVISGAIFWAALFGWNTLVIDYLWFALIVGIFLTGTLSAGMFRAEASGLKEYTGWPGPRELAFFLTVGILFAVPALILPVPLNTDAQGMGYLALMLRSGGNFTTLAPYHPEITYLYSPGLPMLAAYLSQQLHSSLQNIQLGIGAVLPVLFIWVAYDFGNEIAPDESRHLGIAMAFCALVGMGLIVLDLTSHYSAILALIFALAFLTFAIRFYRAGRRGDFIAAAVTLACVALSEPTMMIIVVVGYIVWLIAIGVKGLSNKGVLVRWLLLALGIPALALVGLLPWISRIFPLLGNTSSSLAGDNLAITLIMILYIPLIYLGAVALIWLRDRTGRDRAIGWVRAASLPVMIVLIIVAGLMIGHPDSVARASKQAPLPISGVYASDADVQAMTWLADNAPPDALILNYPGAEGAWVSILAQRNAVYFLIEPFYQHTEQATTLQNALRVFWQNPADAGNAALLKQYGISYVIVPQLINRPDALQSMIRWQAPPTSKAFQPADVPYLQLVEDVDGAQVYKVKG